MTIPRTIHVLILLAASLAGLSLTSPLAKRIVFSPPITQPSAGTVWHVGEKQTVAWNASQIPAGTGPGMVVLGFLTLDPYSENLMLDRPLAKGFSLADGHVDIIVPFVPERNNYIVVVFGDSGNASPTFTILGGPLPGPTTGLATAPIAVTTIGAETDTTTKLPPQAGTTTPTTTAAATEMVTASTPPAAPLVTLPPVRTVPLSTMSDQVGTDTTTTTTRTVVPTQSATASRDSSSSVAERMTPPLLAPGVMLATLASLLAFVGP